MSEPIEVVNPVSTVREVLQGNEQGMTPEQIDANVRRVNGQPS